MTPADLAARLSALDWTQCSLQHQLAIAAAVETLGGKATVVNYPYQPGDPRFDGSEAFECYQTAPQPDVSNVVVLFERHEPVIT